MTVIEGVVPPGGWHYKQGNDTIRAESFTALLEAVLDYRSANRLDFGNVHEDVLNYICSSFPRQCRGSLNVAVGSKTPTIRNTGNDLIDRIQRWAMKIGGLAHRKVTQAQAEKRSEFCVNCPHNVTWRGGCGTCNSNVERLCAIIRGPLEVTYYKRLMACKLLGHDNRTAIFLDSSLVGMSDSLPESCWRKKNL